MKPTIKTKSTKSSIFTTAIILSIIAVIFSIDTASATTVSDWSTAGKAQSSDIGKFVKGVTDIIMVIFALVSVIIAGLAFKGLSGSGDWRTFWNKIAGSIGLFTVPFIINTLIKQGTSGSGG